MFDSIYHMKLKIQKMNFWRENVKSFPYFTQRYNGRHYVSHKSVNHYSGLSNLLHGVISLSDATSCDNKGTITSKSHPFLQYEMFHRYAIHL